MLLLLLRLSTAFGVSAHVTRLSLPAPRCADRSLSCDLSHTLTRTGPASDLGVRLIRGGVAERLIATALKAVNRVLPVRGFESPPLRFSPTIVEKASATHGWCR